jgi:hypothetical protein
MKLYYLIYIFTVFQLVSSRLTKRLSEEEWEILFSELENQSIPSQWVVSSFTSPGSQYSILGGYRVDNGHHEVVAYPIGEDGEMIAGRQIIIMDLAVDWTFFENHLVGKSSANIMLKSWSNPIPKSGDVEWTQLDTFTTESACSPEQLLEAYAGSQGGFEDGQRYFRLNTNSNCQAYASTVMNGIRELL